jgi:septum formation protein
VARLILGSASPRRRALLEARGISLEVVAVDVDEGFEPALEPGPIASELAERKACAISGLVPPDAAFVLTGDTLVVVDQHAGELPLYLGKPANPEQARVMLARLSGTTHRVVTGVAVLRLDDGLLISASETTFVTMRTITAAELDAYVDSGEWRGKAGGYAIQESADRFVEKLDGGGFDNVVGLPVGLALNLLTKQGWVDPAADRG